MPTNAVALGRNQPYYYYNYIDSFKIGELQVSQGRTLLLH